jgi:hypothetical protein
MVWTQIVYNGDADTGAKKFERFVKLGPLVTNLGPIRKLSTVTMASTLTLLTFIAYLELNRMQVNLYTTLTIILHLSRL